MGKELSPPVGIAGVPRGHGLGGCACDAREVVWLHDDVQLHCGWRVADAHGVDLDPEEAASLARQLVQPLQCRAMLGAEGLRDQHGPVRFQPGGVGDQLAQMVVVGGLEEVLDNETVTVFASRNTTSAENGPTATSSPSSSKSIWSALPR